MVLEYGTYGKYGIDILYYGFYVLYYGSKCRIAKKCHRIILEHKHPTSCSIFKT